MGQKGGVFCPPLTCRHLTKREKNAKKNSTPSRTRPTLQKKRLHDGARKKKERRENKKEEERISPAMGLRDPSLDFSGRISAGSRQPWVCETHGLIVCLFFFFFSFQ
jgi:hypothetical protein